MRKKVHFLFLFVLANLVFLGANAQLLLQEGFEGTFPPTGWTLTNNGTGNSWTQNTTATYAYAGSKSMQYLYNFTNAADAWAFTPALSLTTTPVLITFYLRVRSATYPESFQLTIGNDTVVANHTNVLLDSTSITNTVFQKWEVTYTPTSAGTYYLGFNCYSAANMWNVYIDNLTVQTLSACSGKPNAGIATGPSAVCSGQTINVSDSGATFGTGISYQWQNSIDNGATWTDITGATTSSYSTSLTDTTLFRYVTTCSNTSDTAISNVVKVGLNGVLVCAYCSPSNGTTLHNGTSPSIDLVSISGTSLNNASVGVPTNGYNFFPPSTSTTANLAQSLTYNLITNLSGSAIVSVWFDWNQDGVYSGSEWTQIATAGTGLITTAIQVPSNASLGTTGMRIRSRAAGNINDSSSACLTFGSGETEEYVINVVAGTPCSGTPTGGVASGPSSVCSGTNFTISDSGATAAVGINYQWQSSIDNGATWTDVNGATSATYTGTIADTTWFRYKATCTNSSADGYSNSIKVGLNGTLVCAYCSPNNGTTLYSGTGGPIIQAVSITGTSLSNANAAAPTGGYTQFPASGNTTATLTQALTYNLVTTLSATGTAYVWFDWNQDGVYDASEATVITSSGTGAITTQISIPSNATLGEIGMRIRSAYTFDVNGPAAACSTFFAGETEEYLVTIAAGVACTGTPVGGIASGPSSICSGIAFNISDSAFTAASGIAYQWQSSLDNGATWTDITGATTFKYSATITDTTWFRFKVTCTNTSLDGYSNVIKVGLNGTLVCAYCSPNNGTTLHNGTSPSIDLVSITGTTLNNANVGVPTNGYTQFPAGGSTTATLTQSATYDLVTTLSGTAIVSVWFDWNQDGTYDASEWTQITTSGTGTITTQISIPPTSSLGQIGMRVRSRSSGNINGASDACLTFGSGETEEYLINIIPGVTCTGTPSGGSAYTSASSVCSGSNVTIKDSGFTSASGITYQWQSSLDNGVTWTDITGATSSTYTGAITDTTWFRYKVTCTSSNLDGYSNFVKVGLNATLLCAYCSPNNGTTLHGGTSPTVDSVSITGTTLANKNVGAPTNGYTQFGANGNTTAELAQLGTYSLVTKVSGSTIASVWIDYDQNGTYDANEWTQIATAGTGVITTTITIPDTAALGLTGMRIRLRSSGSANGPTNACTQFFSGETEEYFVTIIAPLPVKLSSFTGTHRTNGNVLTWKTLNEQNNTGFKVERSFDGKNFTVVGFVKTSALNGNSSEAVNYQFTDEKPFNNSYYRLRQVDKDGKESYSKIIVVKMLNASELSLMSLYPNPAKNNINLVITGNVDEKVTLIVTDFAGKIVKTQQATLSNSSNIITLGIANLTSGNYLLKVIGKEGTNSAFGKFFKQ